MRKALTPAGWILLCLTPQVAAQGFEIFTLGHPRTFVFQSIASSFSRMMDPPPAGYGGNCAAWIDDIAAAGNGVMCGESLVRTTNTRLAWYESFVQAYPHKITLLHANGNSRKADPAQTTGGIAEPGAVYSAGDWLYFPGTHLLANLANPTGGGISNLEVQDSSVFSMTAGRYGNTGDDIVISSVDLTGKPNWQATEQVKLLDILGPHQIKVQRAQFGSLGGAFAAGAFVAAHMAEGPWSPQTSSTGDHLWWAFDYTKPQTRDKRVAEIESWVYYAPGILRFGGVEFDVMRHTLEGLSKKDEKLDPVPGRRADTDFDGVGDNGYVGSVQTYGVGTILFGQALRTRNPALGLAVDIQADDGARGKSVWMGSEIESFYPSAKEDPAKAFRGWSEGVNLLRFWQATSSPMLNYVNHKFQDPSGSGQAINNCAAIGTCNLQRLSLAVAPLHDAIVTSFGEPIATTPGPAPELFDEMRKGTENQRNWLGSPVGHLVELGRQTPDLLQGEGIAMSPNFVSRWSSSTATISTLPGSVLRITPLPTTTGPTVVTVQLDIVPTGDVLVYFQTRADPLPGHPPEMERQLMVQISGHNPATTSMKSQFTYADGTPFSAEFFWRDAGASGSPIQLTLAISEEDGKAPLDIAHFTHHNAAPCLVREFQDGLIVANPSNLPMSLDLTPYCVGRTLRRLIGSPNQDPGFNTGAVQASPLLLGGLDAIFLRCQ